MGQSEKEGTRVQINSDTKQIFNFLDKYYSLEEGIMMNKIPNTDYFIYGFNKKIKMNETQTHEEQCAQGRRPHIAWKKLYPQISDHCVKVYEGSFEGIFTQSVKVSVASQ